MESFFDSIRRQKPANDQELVAAIAKWLAANARTLDLAGSYGDVIEAADLLFGVAVGEEENS